MECEEKDREYCQVEKMGCEGCYYNEIDKLKKEIEELIKERDYYKKMYNESQKFFVK